jgi:hypothetical protein
VVIVTGATDASFKATLIGKRLFPTAYELENGMPLGGVSAVAHVPGTSTFRMVSDRSNVYDLSIEFNGQQKLEAGAIQVQEAGLIRDEAGKQFRYQGVDIDGADLDPAELDTEGADIANDKLMYISTEANTEMNEASRIMEFSLDGRFLGKDIPLPLNMQSHTSNKGIEGLSLSPDKSVMFIANEEAQAGDGEVSNVTSGVGGSVRMARITLPDGTATKQIRYQLDGLQRNGVTDLIAMDNQGDTVLALERAFDPALGSNIRLYTVSLTDADSHDVSMCADVTNCPMPSGEGVVPPAKKQLLFDLKDFEIHGVQRENYEAMSLGPMLNGAYSLVLLNDDNFKDVQLGTQVLVFLLEESAVLAPSATVAEKSQTQSIDTSRGSMGVYLIAAGVAVVGIFALLAMAMTKGPNDEQALPISAASSHCSNGTPGAAGAVFSL